MSANLAGFVALGALLVGLFAWLRMDIRELRREMADRTDSLRHEMADRTDSLRKEMAERTDSLRQEVVELRERVARIEGLLEAVFMRRDLTPLPDPPPPDNRAAKTQAA